MLGACGAPHAELKRTTTLAEYGPNDPAPKKRRSQLVELLLQFANPLVAILPFASVVSAFVGELVNAGIIIGIVTRSVAVNVRIGMHRGAFGRPTTTGAARSLAGRWKTIWPPQLRNAATARTRCPASDAR